MAHSLLSGFAWPRFPSVVPCVFCGSKVKVSKNLLNSLFFYIFGSRGNHVSRGVVIVMTIEQLPSRFLVVQVVMVTN